MYTAIKIFTSSKLVLEEVAYLRVKIISKFKLDNNFTKQDYIKIYVVDALG